MERYLRVPSGRKVGQKLKLLPFQREIVKAIIDEPTRRVIVSFGRQNGKTTLCAALLLLHIAGPRYTRNGLAVSTALTREQAGLLYQSAARMVRASPELSATVACVDHSKTIRCVELGTQYRALSSDAPSQLGMAPFFIVHDELGSVRDSTSALFDAVESGTLAQADPLSIIISTQAANDNALLSRLIDGAAGDPHTKLFLWSAPQDLDPFSDEALRAANPGFDHFQNQSELRQQASNARRMPAVEPSYRNLILNQRIEAASPFVAPAVWDANGGQPSTLDGATVAGGLDLGSAHDLCALVLVADDGSVHTFAWLPEDGLAEKSRADHAPYLEWARQGHLLTTPGAAVSFEHVALFLRALFGRCRVAGIAFDRAMFKHLEPWLIKAGFSQAEIEAKFQPFGQGFMSMSPAVRALEERLLQGRLRHGNHPVLRMCAANAKVSTDSSGGRKFEKRRSRGRMDAIVSLAMACAVLPDKKPQRPLVMFTVGSRTG